MPYSQGASEIFATVRKLMTMTNVLFVPLLVFLFVFPCAAEEPAGSIPLDTAYDLALKTHPLIKSAEREIVKSKLLPRKAASEYYPRLNGYGNYTEADQEITSGNTVIEPDEQAKADLELIQPLFKATYYPMKEQALREIDKSTELYVLTVQDVFFKVAQSYYQILEAEELIVNAQEFLDLAGEDLRFSKVKFAAGEVTEDAVLQSELNVVQAEGSLLESRNMLRIARDVFKSTVGMATDDFKVVQPLPLVLPKGDLETFYRIALENRADHKVARHNIEQAKTGIKLTRAKYFPTLEGDVNYYVVDQPSFDQNDDNLKGTVKLVIPFYDGGLRHTEMQEKGETLSQTKLARTDLENSIKIEVEDNFIKIETYKTMLENLRKQMELARKNYEITKGKFDYGAATILELDQALTTMNNVKTNLITKTYDYQMAILGLQKAMGLFMKEKGLYALSDMS